MGNRTVNLSLEQVLDYIPESLREKPLYQKTACLLHYIATSPDVYNADLIKEFYDTVLTQDIRRLEELIGAEEFTDLFNLTRRERRTFLQYIKTIYQLKGTIQGLKLVLALLGVTNPGLYEWFTINAAPEEFGFCNDLVHLPPGDPGPPQHGNIGLTHCNITMPPCSFMLEIPQIVITNDFPEGRRDVRVFAPRASESTFEDTLRAFLAQFLHVCIVLEIIRIKVQIEEIWASESEITKVELKINLMNTPCTDHAPVRWERQMPEEFRFYRPLNRTGYHIPLSAKLTHFGTTALMHGGPFLHGGDYIWHGLGFVPPHARRHGEPCIVHNGLTQYANYHGQPNLVHLDVVDGAILHGDLYEPCPFTHGEPGEGALHSDPKTVSLSSPRHISPNDCVCRPDFSIHQDVCPYSTAYDNLEITEVNV